MSKIGKAVRSTRKVAPKVIHPPYLAVHIPAGQATPAPPLGPQLGQRGINVAQFCKEFNERTANVVDGALVPTRININPDRSFTFVTDSPFFTWFILRAAGISRGAMEPRREVAGKITVKHVYEIAKIKVQDEWYRMYTLEEMCKMVIERCNSMGVQVVREDLDPEEYKRFLEERREVVKDQLKQIEELKAAKLMRTT